MQKILKHKNSYLIANLFFFLKKYILGHSVSIDVHITSPDTGERLLMGFKSIVRTRGLINREGQMYNLPFHLKLNF